METNEDVAVYVVQEQPHINFAAAEDYGTVKFVSLRDVPTLKASLRAKDACAEIVRNMEGYRPGTDYILPVGSPVNIACVMMVAGRKGNCHNILKWENRAMRYDTVALEI